MAEHTVNLLSAAETALERLEAICAISQEAVGELILAETRHSAELSNSLCYEVTGRETTQTLELLREAIGAARQESFKEPARSTKDTSARVPWNVMLQNLRVSPCDPRCPELWEVPIQYGTGNVIAVVYGNTAMSGPASRGECLRIAHVMATGQELLSAARVALTWYEHPAVHDAFRGDELLYQWMNEAIALARAAVAKAEGRV